MAPHRNHVEKRANRVPARQFVSDSHDHKPDVDSCIPTAGQIYVGLGWTKDIIVTDCQQMAEQSKVVFAAAGALADAFQKQSMIDVKLASEALSDATKAMLATLNRVNVNGNVLSRKAAEHLNRRARA